MTGWACGCASEECRRYGCQNDPSNRRKRDDAMGVSPRGWTCPACGRGVAPNVIACPCKSPAPGAATSSIGAVIQTLGDLCKADRN